MSAPRSIPVKLLAFNEPYNGPGLHGTGSVEAGRNHSIHWYPELGCFEITYHPPGRDQADCELVSQLQCRKWKLAESLGAKKKGSK